MKKLLLIIFIVPLVSFSQVQIGQNINGEAVDDQSGYSVSISSDGSVVAIGGRLNDGNGNASGHVRVYENNGGTWIQVGQDIDGEAADDQSGWSVDLSSDGSILAIGAIGNGSASGHVRVYENNSGTWAQIGQDIDGEFNSDSSGWAVSLNSDGTVVAIGATSSGALNGHVRVYENNSGTWTQIGQDIDGEAANDESGWSVDLSSNGSIIAVGAIGNNDFTGHVRIFENNGGTWTQIGQDIDGEALDDESGRSVDLSSDGSIVAIGAAGNNGSTGHVRVFENNGGTWTQIGQDINGEAIDNLFGWSVSLSSDGSIIAVGAIGNNNFTGRVRLYNNIGGAWTQIGQDIDGENITDQSGYAVSLSSDGSILAISARNNDDNGNNSGHVRVYDLSAELSIQEQTITDFTLYPNPTKDQFTIKLNNASDLNAVRIYNDLGQLVLTSKETTINTERLASGLYMVEVETSKGKAKEKLIIE